MPASNQLCTWNDIAVEVSANRMAWSSTPQSGNTVVTWASFIANVVNDGTNPGGYASNQCPPYSYLLAHAITILPPSSITVADMGSGECDASWIAPSSGLVPTSYDYQFNIDGAFTNIVGTAAARTGYTNLQSANCKVRSVNGVYKSAYVQSSNITMHVGGA